MTEKITTAVKEKFLQKSKERRYLQIEEVYEQTHSQKITQITRDRLDAGDDGMSTDDELDESDLDDGEDEGKRVKEPPNKRSRYMKMRRRVRDQCWKDEDNDVRETVKRAWLKQKLEFEAARLTGILDTDASAKTPAQLQEYVSRLF